MAWYKSGSVNVTNGSATVYGSGTLWVDVSILYPGDIWVGPDGRLYEVLSIQSNTQLTLASNYLGATANAQSYAIMPIGLLPSALAQQVKATLSTANTALSQAVRFDANQNLTSGQKATARSNIGATAASDVGLGLLSKSVSGGVDIVLSTDEAANLFYEFTGALTASINVVVPSNVRQFFVRNLTSGAFTLTVKTAGGTGIAVPQGTRAQLECDGTNVVWITTLQSVIVADANSGSVGIGVSPKAWYLSALQVRATGLTESSSGGEFTYNAYQYAAGAWKTIASGGAARYGQAGDHRWYVGNAAAGTDVSWVQAMTLDTNGSLGVGTAPRGGAGGFNFLELSSASWMAQAANGNSYFGKNWYYAGTYKYKTANRALLYVQDDSGHSWHVAAVGTADATVAFTQAMTLDVNGNLVVGTTTASGYRFRVATAGAEGSAVALLRSETTGFKTLELFAVAAEAYSASAAGINVGRHTSTNRSINAGGTINASGADYAEYMTKADDCGEVAKGQIIGVDAGGRITDKWANAVSFLIKSTDPSYVGGDKWGTKEALGVERPVEPEFVAPSYTGSAKPDDLADGEASTSDRDAALAQYAADQAAYADAVQASRTHFDTVTVPAYQAALAVFEAKLEAARQQVDRIAYCGQVPVNVQGAQPGQYVVPVQDGDGIGGQLVDDDAITFEQYRRALGVVQNILADGRANIRIKVV